MADAGASFLQGIAPLVATINAQYPQLAPYLQNPEIAQILLEGAAKGQTPDQFQGALQASNWYRSKPPSEREWIVTQLIDPARAAQLQAQTSVQVNQLASEFGVHLDSNQVNLFTQGALAGSWDATEIQRRIVNFSQTQKLAPGQILATQQGLQSTAASYALPVAAGTLRDWATKINNGSQTTQGFTSYAQQQAKILYPSLAKQIDAGQTVKQIGDPYAQIAASTLGIDANSVDWSNPKWSAALQGTPAKAGEPAAPMSLQQWQQTLMTGPQYGFSHSTQGQTDAYNLVNTLKQGFGVNSGA